MSPASFLISYNIVILHLVKNERSSYMHALRAYFLVLPSFRAVAEPIRMQHLHWCTVILLK